MVRLVGAHTDITEQKLRELELEQLNSDLEGFTYIASHDLRAPLVNLRGFASEVEHAVREVDASIDRAKEALSPEDAVRLERAFRKEVPESLHFIKAAVERMDKLTSAIADMSRIGRREYRHGKIDCNDVVARCIASLAHEINKKDVRVEYGNLPVVISDPLAVEQIFGNLLDNAVKYLNPDRAGTIRIEAKQYANETVFTVSDNGRGIAEGDHRKVFEVFRRAGNSGDVRGSGMGMAYVAATLRKLGGRIWLESKLGQGTSFHFSLPLRAEKTQPQANVKEAA
jgi:signal transduction histidine kinase